MQKINLEKILDNISTNTNSAISHIRNNVWQYATLTAFGLASLLTPNYVALADGNPNEKVTFCHATNSEKNPYNINTTAVDSIIKQGHHQHQDKRDIIPPFTYYLMDKGEWTGPFKFPGLNWPDLKYILKNECEIPQPTATLPPPTATYRPTDEPTATLPPPTATNTLPPATPTATLPPGVTPTATLPPTATNTLPPATPTATLPPGVTPTATYTQPPATYTATPLWPTETVYPPTSTPGGFFDDDAAVNPWLLYGLLALPFIGVGATGVNYARKKVVK